MAKAPAKGMSQAAGKGFSELKSRLFFVLGALFVFRLGTFIPVPGIDGSVLTALMEKQEGTILAMFNMFSGGAMSRAIQADAQNTPPRHLTMGNSPLINSWMGASG